MSRNIFAIFAQVLSKEFILEPRARRQKRQIFEDFGGSGILLPHQRDSSK
jgi:hypothetical protein